MSRPGTRTSALLAGHVLAIAESGVVTGPRVLGSGPAPNALFWRREGLAIGAHPCGWPASPVKAFPADRNKGTGPGEPGELPSVGGYDARTTRPGPA
jgi:hypothetical protein